MEVGQTEDVPTDRPAGFCVAQASPRVLGKADWGKAVWGGAWQLMCVPDLKLHRHGDDVLRV